MKAQVPVTIDFIQYISSEQTDWELDSWWSPTYVSWIHAFLMSKTPYTFFIHFISPFFLTKVPETNRDGWGICKGILLSGIYPARLKNRGLSQIPTNTEGDRNSQMPINRTRNKQKMPYREKGISLSHKERYSSLCSTEEAWRHEGKWANAYAWGQIVYGSNNIKQTSYS